MHGAAFLADQNVLNGILLVHGIIQRQYSAARIAKNFSDALILQGLHQNFGTLHLIVRHRLGPFGNSHMRCLRRAQLSPGTNQGTAT